ncbi:MAG: DUF1573 domain-containing protein [Planctomycetota bacterium]
MGNTLVMACCIGLIQTLGTANAAEWAEKMFTETKHDFRTVGRGTTAKYEFAFRNLYEEEVHVMAVRSSCGCTTPSVTKESLSTHESSSIIAELNTSTFIGQKAATITVVFDRPFYAEVQLQVSGYIRTDVTFDPPEVNFGSYNGGETPERIVSISHRGNPAWRISDVRSHCNDLKVRLDPPVIQPGLVTYQMSVTAKEGMPEGDIRQRLTLVTNDRQFPTIEMAVDGRVIPTLTISPEAVSLGTANQGDTVQRRVLVRGETPFAIEEIRCPDKRFEFEIPDGKKKLHFLNLKFNAGDASDRIAQRIEVVTDLPGDKSAQCVATGTIR